MTNGEILQHQMMRCRAFLREAFEKRYPKVVIIHGVGEGVLKSEVHRFLDQQDHLSYHDAPYRTYGFGATEVIIHR
jgi:DNA-nicking Smr family endonuclease